MLRRLLPGDFLGDPFETARNVVLVRSVMPLWGTDEMLRRRGKIKPDGGISALGEKAKLDATLCAGPGNATKALGITTRLNGVDLCTSDEIGLYVPAESETGANGAGLYAPVEPKTGVNEVGLHSFAEPETDAERDASGRAVMPCSDEMLRAIMSARADEIVEAPRIGIDYAEEYAAMKWRYYYRNNRFVSKKLKI